MSSYKCVHSHDDSMKIKTNSSGQVLVTVNQRTVGEAHVLLSKESLLQLHKDIGRILNKGSSQDE